MFKKQPDLSRHDGGQCYECKEDFKEAGQIPRPAGCRAAICGFGCLKKHRKEGCVRKNYPSPKFGERFAGKAAPLSLAVAKVGGIDVQPPFDWYFGSDFFSDEGRAELAAMGSDPSSWLSTTLRNASYSLWHVVGPLLWTMVRASLVHSL